MYDFTQINGFAIQFLVFALQYLRAGLTVPIYFLYAEKVAGRRFDRSHELEKKSQRIVLIITSIQISLLAFELIATILIGLYTTSDTASEQWWLQTMFYSCISLMTVTGVITGWSGWAIRQWKVQELG